ncbi:MAG: Ig-like domain-containing protein [Acidobacteriota bacterium]
MRKIPVLVLALVLSVLVWHPAAQAAPPPALEVPDRPDPVEFDLFFLHLANLDAAADEAEAAGRPAEEVKPWRSHDQRAAGLTDEEGAILRQVAGGCRQFLKERDDWRRLAGTAASQAPAGRKPIVGSSVDELRARLGEEAFRKLYQYVHAKFGRAIQVSGDSPQSPRSVATGSGEDEILEEEIPVGPTAVQPEIRMVSLVDKLGEGEVFAECYTTIYDDLTEQYYGNEGTACQLFGLGVLNVPCNGLGLCSGSFPSPPGSVRWTRGVHYLEMNYSTGCPYTGGPVGLHDPFHYGNPPGTPLPEFPDGVQFFPRLDGGFCWPGSPQNTYYPLAVTNATAMIFLDISPRQVTLRPNEEIQFSSNFPAAWRNYSGVGTLSDTGLYKAPASITSSQTITITACDPFYLPYLGDCQKATVKLEPLKVEVTPDSAEVLPGSSRSFTALVTPSSSGVTVSWSLADPVPGASITPVPASSLAAVFKAPADNQMSGPLEVTVKACVTLDPSPEICGTAKVFVPKLQMYVTAPRRTMVTGETLQLNAFVNGSSEARQVIWETLPDIPDDKFTPITPDTLVVAYKASPFQTGPVDVRVCLQGFGDICSDSFRIDVVDPAVLQSVTGEWNAGELAAPFTITGRGFGPNPSVSFSGLQATILSASDSLISGVVAIPVAMGGGSTSLKLFARYPNGDTFEVSWPQAIPIRPATLTVLPAAVELQAGATQPFSAVCLTARGGACSSPETVSWSASPGAVSPTTGLNVTYTAPTPVTNNTTATVTACWSGTLACATARPTVLPSGPGVTVSPKAVSLQPGQTQQFTVQVNNSSNTSVTWSIPPGAPGNINASGLYTAPATFGGAATVTVTATSQADATRTDTAIVTLVPAPLTLTSTPSPATSYGTAITWTATASGGIPGTYQYALFRRKAGTTLWIPALDSPLWQQGNVLSWTPAPADSGTWEIRIGARDSNTPVNAPVLYDPGPVQVAAPLTLTCSPSPAYATAGTPVSWTATANGGTGVGRQFAFFRRKAGTSSWTPAVTTPAWQASNVSSWTTVATDVGTWEISIWARDSGTPANANGYGAYCIPGPVQIVAPLALTITPSPAAVDAGQPVTWTLTATGGVPGTYQFAWGRKRVGAATWTPDTPVWQTSNVITWTPAATDVGAWEFAMVARDSITPPTMNGVGYAAYANPGQVNVVAPPAVTGTASPAAVYHGNPVTWTVTGSGGTGTGRQYALFRKKAGASNWIPAVTSPAWQSGNVLSWTPASADVGTWEIVIWMKDSNTPPTMNGYGFAAYYNAGPVQVYAHPTVTGTGSPASATWGTTLTWRATGSGGIGSAKQYALFRRKAGTSNWTPAVTSPAWQPGNTLSWTPASTDVGTWEIVVWMKDANTPPTMNGYGYAAYYNAGPVEVTNPIYQYYAPKGWVDGVDRQNIWGWACDPDYPWESNRVDIWTTNWQYLGTAEASFSSSAPINSACGGGSAHYFSFHHGGSIPPGTQLRVWSIDLPYSTPGNDNRAIGGSGSTGDGTVFVMP